MNPEKNNEMQDINIAVMATDIKYIKDSIKKIDDKLELMDGHYIRRAEVDNMKAEGDARHEDFEERIRGLELDASVTKTQIRTWGSIAVLGLGILQFIIAQFY